MPATLKHVHALPGGVSEEVRIAGDRDVRATVDTPGAGTAVVACPPHPRMGGDRRDARLRAVGEALGTADVACVRLDYGPWDEGVGERRDVATALAYARDHYETVGLFGYSFGAAVALLAAASASVSPAALSALAPPATLGEEATAPALDGLDCPVQVCYGEADETVAWEPVVERARERGAVVAGLAAGHPLAGQVDAAAEAVASFFDARL